MKTENIILIGFAIILIVGLVFSLGINYYGL